MSRGKRSNTTNMNLMKIEGASITRPTMFSREDYPYFAGQDGDVQQVYSVLVMVYHDKRSFRG